MKDKKINNPLVLVAPLDWGLGHATRCIPIIRSLLDQDSRVIIASSGPALILLQREFPNLPCLSLDGYNIHYSHKRAWLTFTLLSQVPRVLLTIWKEHRWLKKVVSQYDIDAVISDNRMGLFNRTVKSIYITHQLEIRTGNRVLNGFARKLHYWFISKFNECWVPDLASENNLAGGLSHPARLPATDTRYIGPLSRFQYVETEKKYDLAIVLSGPEPQRTVFENIILKTVDRIKKKIILIRGLPVSSSDNTGMPPFIETKDHLRADELNRVILQSELVIGRSGYSTIMDLVSLQKKAVLVPTPGQTEQEYLARYLSASGLFCSMAQDHFSLEEALKAAERYSYSPRFIEPVIYKKEVMRLVNELRHGTQA